MNYPTSLADLLWRPVATTDPTTPSDAFVQTLDSKLYVHVKTPIRKSNCFLVLRVGEEQAIVGPVASEACLEEVFAGRRPKFVRMSCADILRLFDDSSDKTDADKRLAKELVLQVPEVEASDDGRVFFRDLCRHISDSI